MALISVSISDLLTYHHAKQRLEKLIRHQLNKHEHTLVCIANHQQFSTYDSPAEEVIRREYGKWIVYEAPMAVNLNNGHGEEPRNTLFILEKPLEEA